jgi:hypothetical protein
LEHFVDSFRNLLFNSFAILLDEDEIRMLNFPPITFQSNNQILNYLLSVRKNFSDYLSNINIHTIDNISKISEIDKILEINSKKKFLYEKNGCSLSCYLKLLNYREIDSVFEKLDLKLTLIEEIMIAKLFRIFKFDPCAINQTLKFFEKPRSNNMSKNIRKPKVRVHNNDIPFINITNATNCQKIYEDEHINCAKVY